MKLFSYKRKTVAEGLRVPVSRHYFYSTFGVRGRYATIDQLGTFVTLDTPGTGFFAHASDSHSYQHFVAECRKKQKQNFWTLITHKEPNYAREQHLVESVLNKTDDVHKKIILEHYLNCLIIGKEAEEMERIIRAVKDKMKRSRKSYHTSVISHYKSQIATLEHDISASRLNVKDGMDESTLKLWETVVDKFEVVVNARRLWSVEAGGTHVPDVYHQVFADMGVFDFINSPFDTPIIRDHRNNTYYLFPKALIRARSSVDFDIIPLDTLTFQFVSVDINTLVNYKTNAPKHKKNGHGKPHDAVSNLYGMCHGQLVGEIYVPEIDLRLLCNRKESAEEFVRAINDFKVQGQSASVL